jgi:hypothetical protein
MNKRSAGILLILLGAWVCPTQAFIDGFDTPHDFKTLGVEGTGWEALFGGGDPEALQVEAADGELTMASQGSYWNPEYDDTPGGDYGPFLYITVTGDFIATTRVTGFAGAVGAQVFNNYGGIQARTPGGELINNEDIIQIGYFPTWTGHIAWSHDDNVRIETGQTGAIWSGEDTYAIAESYPYLQLERSANDFHFRISQDGTTWIPLTDEYGLTVGNPVVITRDDMPATLQLGLMHGMSSQDPGGFIQYDFFEVQQRLVTAEGSPVVKESGQMSADFTIRLRENNGPPEADVAVTIIPYALASADPEGNDPNDILLAGAAGPGLPLTVVIPAAQWDDPRTVSVSAVDDALAEGPEQTGVRFETASTDPDYDLHMGTDVLVRVVDNDAPDICPEPTAGGTLVWERGDTDEVAISLATPPAGTVTVTLTSPAGQVTTAPQTLTFTPEDWQTAQLVTVSAIDDDVVEYDPHTGAVALGVSSTADAGYQALQNVPPMPVTILENDCGAWGFAVLDRNTDCVIDLADFAEFAQLWLACTMPNDPACTDLRLP